MIYLLIRFVSFPFILWLFIFLKVLLEIFVISNILAEEARGIHLIYHDYIQHRSGLLVLYIKLVFSIGYLIDKYRGLDRPDTIAL